MESLFKGTVLVVDDKAGDIESGDKINEIIGFLKANHYPCVIETQLPDEPVSYIENLNSFAFLLLDWDLNPLSGEEALGVDTKSTALGTEIIEFIRQIKENVFYPIFIFSSVDPDTIQTKLVEAGILPENSDSNCNILIRKKDDLTDGDVLEVATEWIKTSPSVYVLKEWETEYQKAKARLFIDFYEKEPSWPTILWRVFKEDGQTASMDLGELISRNLETRMAPFEFEGQILDTPDDAPTNEKDLKAVLNGAKFIKNENLHKGSIMPGDLYQSGTGKKARYFLNIRPACDTARSDKKDDEILIYCLRGKIDKPNKDDFGNNSYRDRLDQAFVPCLIDGRAVNFKFKDLIIVNHDCEELTKIGRLIDPYLNQIIQRYGLFMQRQGIPATPKAAFGFPEGQ